MATIVSRSFTCSKAHLLCQPCARISRPRSFPAWCPIYQLPTGSVLRKNLFSSVAHLSQKEDVLEKPQTVEEVLDKPQTSEETIEGPLDQRRKPTRSPTTKTSLRRVAVEAQRSRDIKRAEVSSRERPKRSSKLVTAYAVAEEFNLPKVTEILQAKGYEPDPANTGLTPQVVHIQVPANTIYRTSNISAKDLSIEDVGDVFIFASGTVVTWNLPEGFTSYFATSTLLPAAENPHVKSLETEDLEYVEDSKRRDSDIQGDTIILGTQAQHEGNDSKSLVGPSVDTVLTKIALSSGFARSTKLAVLETMLSDYIDSTRNIPTYLSRGSRLPFNRAFILRKTGQLLSLRAQLNLYSELTDSLPDMLWDSRQELKLEGYYDRVGRALDVGIRIKVLNEKMDYAQEIASVLRERLSEKHGLVLEWTIIILIAVEVGFEMLRMYKVDIMVEKLNNEAASAAASV